MRKYLELIRIRHYLKNFLIFAALAFSGRLFEQERLLHGLGGFVSFCMVSSAVYIINDIQDRKADRLHPTKKKRPIASGEISVRNGIYISLCMLAAGSLINGTVFHLSSTLLLILYFVLNLLYSFGLDDLPIVDISILVSGFLIRVMYGAIITMTEISNWLYLTVLVMSSFLALAKRRNELQIQNVVGETRNVLKFYTHAFLNNTMYMCLTLANVFYALWSTDTKTIAAYQHNYLIFTVPIVLIITMKYSMDIEGKSEGDPVEVLLHDNVLLLLCTIYLIIMFMLIYIV